MGCHRIMTDYPGRPPAGTQLLGKGGGRKRLVLVRL